MTAQTLLPVPPIVRPVVLIILDGVGYREAAPDNAFALAKKPVWDALWRD